MLQQGNAEGLNEIIILCGLQEASLDIDIYVVGCPKADSYQFYEKQMESGCTSYLLGLWKR